MSLGKAVISRASSIFAQTVELPIARLLPLGELHNPLFLIGCGRSGTTIFGECLSKHPSVTYLHERRDIWVQCYPETDVWSRKAESRRGKVVLDKGDARTDASSALRQMFYYQTTKHRRPALVEKLPINNFRTGFLRAVFPESLFVHIIRDGREVARSIEKLADDPRAGWYGANDYKWKQIADLAIQKGVTSDPDGLCTNSYERGLLEWRLSVEAFQAFKRELPDSAVFEISYNELLSDPVHTLGQVLEFAHLPQSSEVSRFAAEKLQRRTSKLDARPFTERELRIGGDTIRKHVSSRHASPSTVAV